jgi:hypothetical protein
MLRVDALHPHNAFAPDDLAVLAQFLDGRSYFHFLHRSVMRPRRRSKAEGSTSTRSPGNNRKKSFPLRVPTCASSVS